LSYGYPDIHLRTFIHPSSSDVLEGVLRRVYIWMALGLFSTAAIAAFVSITPLFYVLTGQPLILFGLLVGELGLVMGLSQGINHIPTLTAFTLFFVYAVMNGLTLSLLFMAYTLGSVTYTFLATATLFGVMAIIGYTTKINLAKSGTFLLMGFIGLLLALLVSIVWASTALEWIVTFAGILLFLVLTMFDTQRIKRMTATALQRSNDNIEDRIGIMGALSLYLDFVNLFLFVLRLNVRRS
jgi:FtsH-binding integral membrane protein